ncbi:hypothetical protein FS837_008523 [Tulasnella sp. UAMH 9824]|nr:hypothetical protein FS837_008523 [Tulasnella sp. UAMH 9824]
MSGSKPNFNTRFAARLALQNDPARKANLDAIAALEELPEAGENGSMLRGKLPSVSNLEPPRGAQTENQASKQETQSVGPDTRNKTSGISNYYGAIQLSGDGGTYLGEPGLPSGAQLRTPHNNLSPTSHILYPSRSAPAPGLPLISLIGPGSHGMNESGTPRQPQPSVDTRPSKRRRISPPRRSPGSQILSSVEASSRSSSVMVDVAAHPTTAKEDTSRGSHYSRSMASSLDPARVSGSSARGSRPVTGAAVLSTVGPSNSQSPGVYSQTSNVPVQAPQSSSNLERMLGAGISPSDEMRRVFGRAVDRMLPNVEAPDTARTAGIEDNDLDGHIRQVAPILRTAYSQLVNAGLASPLQLQDAANPLPAPHRSLQRPEADADPSENSRSGTITMHNSRKLKHRPPDTGDQPPNILPGGSPTPAPSSRGTSLSGTPNHARDTQLHNGSEQFGTRSKEQSQMSCGLDGCKSELLCEGATFTDCCLGDHSEHCSEKVNGQGVLRLPKEGTHGTPAAVTVQAGAIPSQIGTLESSISNLNEYLAKLETELQTAVFCSSNHPSMSTHVKEQALPTVVLELLGPPQLSTGRYTFEVALPEAEAANRWSKRNDLFE